MRSVTPSIESAVSRLAPGFRALSIVVESAPVADPAVAEQALAEAKAQGIHGKETTPFLLAKVKDLTGGDSLESNIQLVYNNAVLGAKTACALAALKG